MTGFPMTLWRYFFRRYTSTFIAYFLAIVVIILLVDFNENSSRISDAPGYTILLGFYISALRVPLVAQTAIPFIVLIASIATLMQLNRKYELVVTRASGVSVWQFLSPLLAGNIIIGLLALFVLNPLATSATSLVEKVMLDYNLGSTRAPNATTEAPWLRQRTAEGDTVIGAMNHAENGTLLGNATFIRFDPEGDPIDRLEAVRARLGDGAWHLENVTRFVPGAPAEAIADLSIPTNLRAEFLGESLAPANSIPIYQLPAKIAAARSYGIAANSYSMQLHRLVAQPALLAAMTLIAAMVSLKFVRFGQSIAVILGGILAGFVLYVVSEVIRAFGNAGTIPPVVAAWLPVIVASALGATVLLHKEDG